jgi:cold-inducible RNA-binding protein
MNIYVANVSFHTGEEELKDLFSPYGTVSSARLITDKGTNRSRGFAFIEMPSEEEGHAAISGLNGKEIEGRALLVSVAREKEGHGGNKRLF